MPCDMRWNGWRLHRTPIVITRRPWLEHWPVYF
jgi:hypothetical protein